MRLTVINKTNPLALFCIHISCCFVFFSVVVWSDKAFLLRLPTQRDKVCVCVCGGECIVLQYCAGIKVVAQFALTQLNVIKYYER